MKCGLQIQGSFISFVKKHYCFVCNFSPFCKFIIHRSSANFRYLAINCKYDFPSSISVLWHLKALIVYSPQHLLPNIASKLCDMRKLRHLKLLRIFLPSTQFAEVLENPRTIPAVANFVCTDMVIRNIPNLTKLGIYLGGNDEKKVLRSYNSLSNLYKCKNHGTMQMQINV